MLERIDYKNQTKSILVSKGQSAYKKLEEMNQPPSEYNAINSLVETNEHVSAP